MTKQQLMEQLKKTGNDEMEVFARGDNGSIISVDDVIVMGDGSGRDSICLINGPAGISVKEEISNLCKKKRRKNMEMMSLKRTTYVTTRYDVYGGFYVEVTKNPEKDYVDFVLCRENYGFKNYMIGIPTKDCPESVWEDLIRRNVDSYIAGFIQDIECLESQPM
jgi:hypothetical protein